MPGVRARLRRRPRRDRRSGPGGRGAARPVAHRTQDGAGHHRPPSVPPLRGRALHRGMPRGGDNQGRSRRARDHRRREMRRPRRVRQGLPVRRDRAPARGESGHQVRPLPRARCRRPRPRVRRGVPGERAHLRRARRGPVRGRPGGLPRLPLVQEGVPRPGHLGREEGAPRDRSGCVHALREVLPGLSFLSDTIPLCGTRGRIRRFRRLWGLRSRQRAAGGYKRAGGITCPGRSSRRSSGARTSG